MINKRIKEKLPKCITRTVVETNSSSTHTLSICFKDPLIKREDEDCNLPIEEDNILRITYEDVEQLDFSWGWSKYNDCLSKLCYAIGLAYSDAECETQASIINYKLIHKFKSIIIDYLRLKDILFEWDEQYLSSSSQKHISYPEIDHQSAPDGIIQVLENKESILNFIFSRRSWLYIGNDNDPIPKGFYKESIIGGDEDDDREAMILRIDFGVLLKGRYVDFPYNNIYRSSCGDGFEHEKYDIYGIIDVSLSYTQLRYRYNTETGMIEFSDRFSNRVPKKPQSIKISSSTQSTQPILLDRHDIVQDDKGNLYLMFFGWDGNGPFNISNQEQVSLFDYMYNNVYDINKFALRSCSSRNIVTVVRELFREGIDFKLFPAEIIL